MLYRATAIIMALTGSSEKITPLLMLLNKSNILEKVIEHNYYLINAILIQKFR